MDYIKSTTEKVPQMRSLESIKGKVKKKLVKIGGEAITPIQEQPIKCLRKDYNDKLNERDQIDFITRTWGGQGKASAQ